MKKINENQKVTLTLGQLKKLVKEAKSSTKRGINVLYEGMPEFEFTYAINRPSSGGVSLITLAGYDDLWTYLRVFLEDSDAIATAAYEIQKLEVGESCQPIKWDQDVWVRIM